MIKDEEKSFFNKHEQTVLRHQAFKNRTAIGEYASAPKPKNEEEYANGYSIASIKANPKGYFWSAKLGTSGSRKLSASPQPEIRPQPKNDKVIIVKKNFRPTKFATLEKINETNPTKGSDFMKLKHKNEDFLHFTETTEKYIIRPRCPLPQINKNTSVIDGHFRLKDTSTLSFLNDSFFESKHSSHQHGRSKNYFSDVTGPLSKNYLNSRNAATKTDLAEEKEPPKPSNQRQKSVAPLKNRGNSLINQQKLISNSPISFQNLKENANILSNSGDAIWKTEINNKSPFEFKDDILLLPSFPDKRRIKTEVSTNEGLFQEIFELLKDPAHVRNKTPAISPNALPDKEPSISTTQYKKNPKSFKTQIKKTILMDEHLQIKSPEVKKKFQFIVKAMIQERNIIKKNNSSKKVSLPPSRKKASRSNTPNEERNNHYDTLSSSTIETKQNYQSKTTKDLRKSPYIGHLRKGFLQNEENDKSPHSSSHKKTLKALEDHLLLQQGNDDVFTGWEEPANDDF